MSEKMVVVGGEEEERSKGGCKERCLKEKDILGCWLQQGVVAMFTMDKQKQRAALLYCTRKVSHWLKEASELRHATNNAGSRAVAAGETPILTSAANWRFQTATGECSAFSSRYCGQLLAARDVKNTYTAFDCVSGIVIQRQ